MLDLTARPLITDDDLKRVAFGETVRIDEKVLVTPLAADTARERGLRLERVAVAPAQSNANRSRRVAMGADHGGFEL